MVLQLGIERVDVMGFSNGGPTALRFAQRHTPLTRRIVVASGMCRRSGMVDGFWSAFDDPDIGDMPGDLAEAYRAINPDPTDLARMFGLDVALMRSFTDIDDAQLAAVTAPALFIGGDRDVVRPDHILEMAAAVADGRPIVVPAGHGDYLGMSHLGHRDTVLADACLDLIDRFLTD